MKLCDGTAIGEINALFFMILNYRQLPWNPPIGLQSSDIKVCIGFYIIFLSSVRALYHPFRKTSKQNMKATSSFLLIGKNMAFSIHFSEALLFS
jgi:hypothetical protein